MIGQVKNLSFNFLEYFVEFCDEKNFTNGKNCNIMFLELNLIQTRFVQKNFSKNQVFHTKEQ